METLLRSICTIVSNGEDVTSVTFESEVEHAEIEGEFKPGNDNRTETPAFQ